jgi:hypothetical protein
VFSVAAVERPAPYTFVSANTPEVMGLVGWLSSPDSTTIESALVAWTWARLVAPSVAEQLQLPLASLHKEVLLTSSTSWYPLSGSSAGVVLALALLQMFVPGVSYRTDQAATGAIHLGGLISRVE